jgi:cation transport ATPase
LTASEHIPAAVSQPGSLTVTSPEIFSPGHEDRAALFARRVLRVAAVRTLEIDPARATATVRYRRLMISDDAIVRRIARAAKDNEPLPPEALPPWRHGAPVVFYRDGDVISTLEVLLMTRRRLRLHHATFSRDPVAAQQIEDTIRLQAGVHEAVLNVPAGTLDIRFDPKLTAGLSLLRLVETAILDPSEHPASPMAGPGNFATSLLALGVAATGELITPAALPVAAALLVFMNLGTFRAGIRQIGHGKAGLPVLYSTIVVMTLASGSFLSAAMMFFSFRYWERRHRHDIAEHNAALLHEIHNLPHQARVVASGGYERMVLSSEIEPGWLVRVPAGETIPVDGKVTGGTALVDEGIPGGGRGARSRGDDVLAGGVVLAGSIDVETIRSGPRVRVSTFARALLAATVPAPAVWTLTPEAERFAEKTVPWTFAAAAAGFAVGGAPVANCVLRPDYATGVGLAGPLRMLRANRIAMRHGALIRSHEALGPLAAKGWVVIDDHPALTGTGCEIADFRAHGVGENDMLPAVAAAAAWLGDARAAALAHACAQRGLIARHAPLHSFDDAGVSIVYGGHVVRLREAGHRSQFPPLRIEVDGFEAAGVDFRPKHGQVAAAETVRQLQRGGRHVFLASSAGEPEAADRAAMIGANGHAGDIDDRKLCTLLRDLHDRGTNVVHVRNGPALPHARDGYVSVALAGPDGIRLDADVPLCGQSIAPLPDLIDLATETRRHDRQDRWSIVAPNGLGVAGVFAFDFSGLTVVLISNFANYVVQKRASRALASAGGGHSEITRKGLP